MFILAFVMMIAMAVSALIALHNEARQFGALSVRDTQPFAPLHRDTERF